MIKVDETFQIDYIDASSHCDFTRCPAKYLFSRLMGLYQVDAMVIAMDFGTDLHLALPYCYKGLAGVAKAIEVFTNAWNLRSYGDEDPKRNIQRASEMLTDFAECHEPSLCAYRVANLEIEKPTDEKVGENEVPFLIDIGGDLPYAGRIDMNTIWKATGDLGLLILRLPQKFHLV